MKRALILGISGQDGSYLSELLLLKGYDVYGIIRRSSWPNTGRIDHIFSPTQKGKIFYGDLEEGIDNILYRIKPDEVYNLAAMSHVRISFDVPIYTGEVVAIGVTKLLEAIKRGIDNKILKSDIKYYQASSSEMFGLTPPPQNEKTKMDPISPYGAAKLYAYHMTRTYRFGYNMFACNGILFNHESERRGVNFVTRKVTRAIAKIKLGKLDKLPLGNLEAKRDWGHSKDYMEAIYRIMQHDKPDDFVVSTGQYYTVKEFIEEAFAVVELDPWKYIVIEEYYKRPNEVPALLGDSKKIRETLGWKPKIGFKQLVRDMILYDLEQEKKI